MTFGEALALMRSALSVADLERTGITYEVELGDDKLAENTHPPRITLVPQSSQPSMVRINVRGVPRSVAAEKHIFRAEIWGLMPKTETTTTVGRDYVQVSIMRSTFAQAMRKAFGTAFEMLDGEWSESGGGSEEQLGRKYLQRFSLDGLFLDVSPTTAVVEHVDMNFGITDPGQDQTFPVP